MAIELGVSSIPVSEVSPHSRHQNQRTKAFSKVLLRGTLQDRRGLRPLRLLQGSRHLARRRRPSEEPSQVFEGQEGELAHHCFISWDTCVHQRGVSSERIFSAACHRESFPPRLMS